MSELNLSRSSVITRLPFVFILLSMFCFQGYTVAQAAESEVSKAEKLIQASSYEEALEHLNKAIELKPDLLDAFVNRAFVHSLLKDYENAVADYSRVIELNSNFVRAYISRGSAFNKLNKFDDAIRDFNKALEIDPKNSEAYNNRGWSKKGLGDKDGACKDWKTSKKMGNEEAKIILKNNQC